MMLYIHGTTCTEHCGLAIISIISSGKYLRLGFHTCHNFCVAATRLCFAEIVRQYIRYKCAIQWMLQGKGE